MLTSLSLHSFQFSWKKALTERGERFKCVVLGAQVCAEGKKGVTLMMINWASMLNECHVHQHVHFKPPNEVKPPLFTCCIFLMPDFYIVLKSISSFSHLHLIATLVFFFLFILEHHLGAVILRLSLRLFSQKSILENKFYSPKSIKMLHTTTQ